MNGQDIAIIAGVLIVANSIKDVAVHLIKTGLNGRISGNGNGKVCNYHGALVNDIAEVKTDVKWIRGFIMNGGSRLKPTVNAGD